jgi:hypothetical protein
VTVQRGERDTQSPRLFLDLARTRHAHYVSKPSIVEKLGDESNSEDGRTAVAQANYHAGLDEPSGVPAGLPLESLHIHE